MNVYKFGIKPKIVQHCKRSEAPKTIFWKLFEVNHPPKKVNPVLWEIFAQQPLVLGSGETKSLSLGFGFIMSRGVVLTSLSYNLKLKLLSLSNEVILNDTDDIVITITNNSSNLLRIEESEFLCHVCYAL